MVTSERDWPVNKPSQPVACGNRWVQRYGQEQLIYVCDLPKGHLGMHAHGINMWGGE